MKRLLILNLMTLIGLSAYSQGTQVGDANSPIYHYNGNVGIRTTTPSIDLEIAPTTHRPVIWLNSRGTGNSLNTDIFLGDNGNKRWSITHRPNDQNGDFVIWRNNSGWTKSLSINYSNGQIGIGTTIPKATLDISGPSTGSSNLSNPTFKVSAGSTSGRVAMWLDTENDNATDFVFRNNGTGRVWMSSRNSSENYGFRIYTNPDETGGPEIMALSISQTGNIGIATTSTGSHKLAVEGSIGAREIKVEASGWSDFVFEKDYELRTLREVENFIDQHGHLPDIPSAEKVKADGISLGEMDAKLLQKIEELTLYVIQQNKKLESQGLKLEVMEKQNEDQAKKIQILEAKLEEL